MTKNLKKISNFVSLELVAFKRRINDLKEQPLPSVPEIDQVVAEPDTDVLLNEDDLDHEFEEN